MPRKYWTENKWTRKLLSSSWSISTVLCSHNFFCWCSVCVLLELQAHTRTEMYLNFIHVIKWETKGPCACFPCDIWVTIWVNRTTSLLAIFVGHDGEDRAWQTRGGDSRVKWRRREGQGRAGLSKWGQGRLKQDRKMESWAGQDSKGQDRHSMACDRRQKKEEREWEK